MNTDPNEKEEQERKDFEKQLADMLERQDREREKQDRLNAARNSGGLVSEAEVLADYDK